MDHKMMTFNTPTADFKCLWAKSNPRHPLWKHMLDAAAVSLAFSPPFIGFGWKPEATAFLVGLHDVGKADSCFQHQIPDFSLELVGVGYKPTNDARCRHERISARFIKKRLVSDGLDDFTADAVARTLVVHHGYWNEAARDAAPEYMEAQRDLCRMLQQLLGVERFPSGAMFDLSAFGMRLAGHVVLSDWIASNEEFFGDARLKDIDDPGEYFARVKVLAKEWIDRLGLGRDADAGKASSIVEVPRPVQQLLLEKDIPPCLVIIEAPMGEGKTEAAWILAEKWRDKGYYGMYMALPTMATSDSLHGRYHNDYLIKLNRGRGVKLVHGMAWLRDEKEPKRLPQIGEPGDEDDQSFAAAWFRPTRRAMLAAHGVGTIDQAMLAGMNVKFGFLRLAGLANRVLVIDEVHAYDAYMSAIIARLLQWCSCLRIPVILLSATLSARQRTEMIEAYGATNGDPGPNASYPLVTIVEPGKEAWTVSADASSNRTLKIETHAGLLGDAKKSAAKAIELVKDGGCCCVILNTVKQAQAVYEELKKLPVNEKLLFHSRFSASDRKDISEKVIDLFGKGHWEGEGDERRHVPPNRPSKFVLVATQVVEQSLDVDFDYMISELAPIDLLLQRSGRIKRHSRDKNGNIVDGTDQRGEPVIHILVPIVEGTKPPKMGVSEVIYQRYPLLRTLEVLKEKKQRGNKQVRLPEEFRPLIEAVYGEALPTSASEEDIEMARLLWNEFQWDLASQAGQFLLCEPMADEFDPVGADEVGDDSDDGNGWRGRTRLGLEDVLVIPVGPEELPSLKKKDVDRGKVKELYQRSVKIPSHTHYWPPRTSDKKGGPVLIRTGRLRGAWLLPVKKEDDGWSWSGIKNDNKPYQIRYHRETGLTHGGEK